MSPVIPAAGDVLELAQLRTENGDLRNALEAAQRTVDHLEERLAEAASVSAPAAHPPAVAERARNRSSGRVRAVGCVCVFVCVFVCVCVCARAPFAWQRVAVGVVFHTPLCTCFLSGSIK